MYTCAMGSNSFLIRVGLTPSEWSRIRARARREGISAKKLVTDAIRESLLTKGAKP